MHYTKTFSILLFFIRKGVLTSVPNRNHIWKSFIVKIANSLTFILLVLLLLLLVVLLLLLLVLLLFLFCANKVYSTLMTIYLPGVILCSNVP